MSTWLLLPTGILAYFAGGLTRWAIERVTARRHPAVIREIGIIRNIQPDDCIVLTVPANTSMDTMHRMGETLRGKFDCASMVLPASVSVDHRQQTTPATDQQGATPA